MHEGRDSVRVGRAVVGGGERRWAVAGGGRREWPRFDARFGARVGVRLGWCT